ncbi:hypothetical protein LEMLEM_LOCUS733, partial [Lemmus lemmus]
MLCSLVLVTESAIPGRVAGHYFILHQRKVKVESTPPTRPLSAWSYQRLLLVMPPPTHTLC